LPDAQPSSEPLAIPSFRRRGRARDESGDRMERIATPPLKAAGTLTVRVSARPIPSTRSSVCRSRIRSRTMLAVAVTRRTPMAVGKTTARTTSPARNGRTLLRATDPTKGAAQATTLTLAPAARSMTLHRWTRVA
jgi:hypothetical protein